MDMAVPYLRAVMSEAEAIEAEAVAREGGGARAVRTREEEVRGVLGGASQRGDGRPRRDARLALRCGQYEVDVVRIEQQQQNWRISRQQYRRDGLADLAYHHNRRQERDEEAQRDFRSAARHRDAPSQLRFTRLQVLLDVLGDLLFHHERQ